MEPHSKKLGEILVEKGVLTPRQLNAALNIQKKRGGRLGEILIKEGFVKDEDIIQVFSQHLDYIYVHHNPIKSLKTKIAVIAASVVFSALLLLLFEKLPFFKDINYKILGGLMKIERLIQGPPAQAKDIVIVAIDNETLLHMPNRWPYPQADFATVINNLKKANPKAIGINFAYLGKSTKEEDDQALKAAFNYDRLVLAAAINEKGYLDTSYIPKVDASYGIVTKLQDEDGIIRRNLIYLMNKNKEAFLSWEMQLLKQTKDIDIETMTDQNNTISFQSRDNTEQWLIPVDPATRSFLIHVRARTQDFEIISFYNALFDNFDPMLIKNKIVLLGVLPSIFQDIQNTPIGALPGVILNANAFLNLYTHDFLKEVPSLVQDALIVLCVALTALFLLTFGNLRAQVVIILEICFFLLLSYFLLVHGCVINYMTFPLVICICPLLSRKIFSSSSFGL